MEFSLSTIRREMVEISTFTADSRTARGTGECSNTGFDRFAAPLIRKDQIRATTKNAPNQRIQLGGGLLGTFSRQDQRAAMGVPAIEPVHRHPSSTAARRPPSILGCGIAGNLLIRSHLDVGQRIYISGQRSPANRASVGLRRDSRNTR